MTPRERANEALGGLVVSHSWLAGGYEAVVRQIEAALAAEREACAALAEQRVDGCSADATCYLTIAAAIRARGAAREGAR